MHKEFKLIISNGQLWCYILNQEVHLFSLGDWLASYQIPEKYSLLNEIPSRDYGDLAIFQYKNFRREISIKDNNFFDKSPFAEVYLSEQKNPIPLTSCIEQRWSAAVPWLAMIEGIFGLNVQYNESLELPAEALDSEIGNVEIEDVIIRNRKYRMIVDKDRMPIIQR